MGIERRTSNVELPTSNGRKEVAGAAFDLEDRLLEYAARICRLSENVPRTRAGNHAAKQLLRSGTSPLPNHGEAQAAESRDDFLHKMRICLKELRETRRWLRLICHVPLLKQLDEVHKLIDETRQLIKIFFVSIRTAENNSNWKRRGKKP